MPRANSNPIAHVAIMEFSCWRALMLVKVLIGMLDTFMSMLPAAKTSRGALQLH